MREIIRDKEVKIVTEGLARGRWFIIYAPSGSGKTTFLSQLEGRLGQNYRVKYLSLRSCTGLELDEIYTCLAGVIRPGTKVANALEFRQLLAGLSGKTVLLLDDAGSLSPAAAGPFLNNISALHCESKLNPRLKGLGLVLTSSRDLRELSEGIHSCLNTLEELFLPDFSEAETLGLTGSREIWQLTQGHPWLTAYLVGQTRYGTGNSLLKSEQIVQTGNSIIDSLRSRLVPELFTGYRFGVWTDHKLARKLRLFGLARWQDGELVVRNPVYAKVIDQYLNDACLSPDQVTEVKERLEVYVPDNVLWLSLERKEVWLDGREVRLTPAEFRILAHLVQNCPQVLSKDSLAAAAFPGEPVAMTDVETHIKNIRRKLGDKAKDSRFIRTRRSLGYQAIPGSFCLE